MEFTSDIPLIQLDLYGNKQWNRIISETGCSLTATCIQETFDGGYIIAGARSGNSKGESDFLIIKTDTQGNMLWHNSFGGPHDDKASFVQDTSDNCYIIAVSIDSNYCVIKLKADQIGPDKVSTRLESIQTQPLHIPGQIKSIPTQPLYIPGFGVVFSILNLLVVTCMMLKIKRKQRDINLR